MTLVTRFPKITLMNNPEEVINKIRSKGHRITRVRGLVAELFINSSEPLTAQDLISGLHAMEMKVNKTTVYRELTFLLNNGIVKAVDFGDGTKRYELAGDEHHHHLICINCKKVEDVDLNMDLDKEEAKIAKEKNFKILNHSLEFFGLCSSCQ